jgi:methyl-accepting chemotaxis protein
MVLCGRKEKYGHLKEMQEFEIEHEKLHAVVKEIVQLKSAGKTELAEDKYQLLLSISDKIILYLDTV